MHFCHLRSVTETPTWGFIENLMATRYPPYTPEKLKKMQKLAGEAKPPFTHAEGSADRPQGVTGWVYAAGLAVIGGLAGILYKQKQSVRL
jgi:beta-apo-4'-carotenal oxygenase